jgi:hypothetical protein
MVNTVNQLGPVKKINLISLVMYERSKRLVVTSTASTGFAVVVVFAPLDYQKISTRKAVLSPIVNDHVTVIAHFSRSLLTLLNSSL